MELRPISKSDIKLLDGFSYGAMPEREKQKMIEESVSKMHEGKYFELFLVFQNAKCIGIMNVFEHTECIVSVAPEILESERHKGYGFEAMIAILSLMYEKDYTIAVADVDFSSVAGIKLHEKLAFERERTYTKDGKTMALYIRTLREFGEI
ncbi:MAG: GNAT family N-acetyltransferase [Ruminococcaceae bacterium]|nr:GNAT family N-acetyltransferase [Oscillospiraceae bacterium]